MARRSDHTREELKKLAISAGQRIIANEGFSKFSARKVAKEIGYSIGTIYNIFESHDDLILHINAVTISDMHNYISENFENSDHYAQTIKNLAKLYISFANENYNRWSALFEFNLPQNTSLPNWYLGKIEELFTLIEAPLSALIEGNKTEVQRAAKIIWASIHGICQLGLTGKLDNVGAESIDILVDTLIDKFIRGLES